MLVLFLVLNLRTWALFFASLGVALAGYGLYRWLDWRRHGPRGKPVAALQDETLFFTDPGLFKPFVEIPLAELAEVLIHGVAGQRRFRFIRKDGGHQELQPFFGEPLEAAVSQFLTTALAAKVKVSVKASASFFERTRGDDGL